MIVIENGIQITYTEKQLNQLKERFITIDELIIKAESKDKTIWLDQEMYVKFDRIYIPVIKKMVYYIWWKELYCYAHVEFGDYEKIKNLYDLQVIHFRKMLNNYHGKDYELIEEDKFKINVENYKSEIMPIENYMQLSLFDSF